MKTTFCFFPMNSLHKQNNLHATFRCYHCGKTVEVNSIALLDKNNQLIKNAQGQIKFGFKPPVRICKKGSE